MLINMSITKKNYTPTHFRIDSLLMGVIISFFYHFKQNKLKYFLNKQKMLLAIFIFGLHL